MSIRGGMSICLALGLVFVFGAYSDTDARGKRLPTVECTQDGREITAVAAGTQVTITGNGYRSNVYLTICVEDEGCTGSRTNSETTKNGGHPLIVSCEPSIRQLSRIV